MNRELKFRAWDETNKKWANAGFNLFGEVTIFNILQQYKLEDACNSFVFNQYTGLKDKNGVEIYEGDILLHQSWTDQGNTTYHNVIEYYSGMSYCGFRMKNGRFTKALRRNNILDDVVVGNIYEHPHLLKCTKSR